MEEWVIDRDHPETVLGHITARRNSSPPLQLVCIDYFDTLVSRFIVPEHTKILAAAVLARLGTGTLTGTELYQIRRDLELELTNRNAEQTGELDFCLADFAHRFWETLRGLGVVVARLNEQEFVDTLISIEVAVEKAVQVIFPQSLQVLQGLRQQGVPMVLVSDFYLPEEGFKKILKALDLDSFFSRIYISSSLGKSKGAGTIYPLIAEQGNCPPERMMMIGDNPHADIKMAREFGIPTLHVQPPSRKLVNVHLTENSREEKQKLALTTLGELPLTGHFGEMACSLWLFTHRLFTELWRNGARDVFFLSKEGEFLKKLFVHYQEEIFGGELIRSHYLLASRKATFLPSLRPLVYEDFLRLLAHYRDLSLREFLQSLNLRGSIIDKICDQLQPLNSSERLVDLHTRPEFHTLLGLPLFQEVYEARRVDQRNNFISYLDSFGVNYRENGLHLVDVGWKGSIQDNIFYILDQTVPVQGYYIGSFHATERGERNRKKGLLFDNYQQLSPFFNVYNNNRSLYEMLLGASHGSADCYVKTHPYGEQDEPMHQEIHSRILTETGELAVLVFDMPEERSLYEKVIQPLQGNMLRTFAFLNKSYLLAGCVCLPREWFARQHARMVYTPSQEEVNFFAGLYHLENFGIFEYTNFQTDAPRTLRERCRNLKNVLRHPAVLETGIWPPIILRRLGLGFLQYFDGRKRMCKEFARQARNGYQFDD